MLLEQISQRLLLPPKYIGNLAAGASHHYKAYQISKKRGGTRLIEHPSKPLKAVQRWLATNVISHFPIHGAASAYRRGTNVAQNARRHADSSFLVRLDLHDFFHSLTAPDVAQLIQSSIVYVPDGDKWTPDDIDLFVRLVCKDGRLTIGAPTSPPLCNALCYQMDLQLTAFADRRELAYSRYADDLVFSARSPDQLKNVDSEVTNILKSLDLPKNLRLNTAKTWHVSRKGRRKVTGVVITCDGKLSVGRPLKRRLRSEVFKWHTLDAPRKKSLAGWLAYVRSVEPEFINSLILKYGADRIIDAMHPHG